MVDSCEIAAPARPPDADRRPGGRLRRLLLGSVAGLAVTAGSSPAMAQYAPPAAGQAAPAGGDGPVQLPALSVQGSGGATDYKADRPSLPKLTEPLLDTPQVISVVPRQVLDDQGITTLRDALRNVPGISLAAGEGGAQGDSLTIRGFSARNDIYLDGMRDFGSYYRDPFYLEDIQVLKGPASILFGRGSTGGVVEQDSKVPKLDPFVSGTFAIGNDLTRRATSDINQPLPELGQGAALRLNAMVQDGNVTDRGFARNSRFGLAPSLAFGMGTPTRTLFTYLHQSEYDVPDYGLPWLYQGKAGTVTALARPAPLDLTQSNYYGFKSSNYLRTNVDVGTAKIEHDVNEWVTVSDQLRYAHYVRQFRITEPQTLTPASAAARGGSGTLLLITPGTPLSTINVSRNQLTGRSLETFLQNQSDATFRFKTGFAGHVLRAGLEFGRETSSPIRYTTIGPYSQTPLLSPHPGDTPNASYFLSSFTNTTAVTQAAYVLDTITFDPQWQFMGGVRFDRFDATYGQLTNSNPVTRAPTAAADFHHVDKMFSYRAALIYKPVPEGSVYFSYGTSFNPSAEALSLSAATAPLPPVKNRTFEIGSKWDLNDGKLAVSAALFRSEQTNVREPNPLNSLVNILAGNATADGGEIQVAGKITDPWQVIAGYGYTYAVINKSPVTGPTSDLGRRLANVPAHTASLWTTYDLPFKLQIGGGLNVVSSRYASNTPTTVGGVAFFKEAGGYWTLGAMAKYPLTDAVSLQVNFSNLLNQRFYDQLHPSHVVPGAGRTVLFTLAYKY